MGDWSPTEWATFLTVAGTAATGFYLTVVRPLLAQIGELIAALTANTDATDRSEGALTALAPAVVANTVATSAVAEGQPAGPVTVNVGAEPPGLAAVPPNVRPMRAPDA